MDVIESGSTRMRRTITRLASYTVADAELDAPTLHNLYTCPRTKKAIIDHLRFHSNAGSLAGMNDIDIGGGAAAVTPAWKTTADVSSMTTAQMEMKISSDGAVVIIDGDDATVANRTLSARVIAGATTTTTVIIEVWGYLIDS